MSVRQRMTRKSIIAGIALALAFASVPVQPARSAIAAPAVAASKAVKQPIDVDDVAIAEKLFGFIAEELKLSEAEASELDASRLMEVFLGGVPAGYARQFVSFVYREETGIELLLLAADANLTRMRLLGSADSSEEGALFINMGKLELSTDNDRLIVWTQAPFRAFESNAELQWNGEKLIVAVHEYDDPSQAYFDKKGELIRKKDIAGLLRLDETDAASYPAFYQEYFELAGPALLLSHQKALGFYQQDLKTAIRYLAYGLGQYADAFGVRYEDGKLTKADIVGSSEEFAMQPTIGFGKYVAILNDYAYFLTLAGRNKEAKPLLANVVKLAPDRVVAYLNLADAEWALGLKADAKTHYKQYWKLLGSKAAKVAPKRVQERIKAK
ncbi:type IV pilus biogenesis/stability protein PilW [Cohnella sp. GCM10027633]|uniref:type IV pilus biogenesis/stability protein PilW n=1 Tax=unclassified Cohnella TaxID=2636738 RepID=UPI00363E8BAC